MGQIKVDASTNRLHIQQQLEKFGVFSKVEAVVRHPEASTVYLREVGLRERVRRLFSPGAAREAAQKSRDAMLKLAETHPEIGKLLGMSLLEPRAWSPSELRRGLKVGSSQLEPGLADRIWERKAVLDTAARAPAKPGSGTVAMPAALRVLAGPQAAHAKREGMDVTGKCAPSSNPFVSFWHGDPAQLAADALFLHPEEVRQQALVSQRAGHGELQRVHAEAYENDGLVGREAQAIMTRSAEQWGIAVIELPACDLPAQRLFAFSRPGLYQTTHAAAKDFFITHLNSLSGRVVIALTGDPEIDSVACDAARDMKQPPPPEYREVIFASSDSEVLAATQGMVR